jgi:hypothetical protein
MVKDSRNPEIRGQKAAKLRRFVVKDSHNAEIRGQMLSTLRDNTL